MKTYYIIHFVTLNNEIIDFSPNKINLDYDKMYAYAVKLKNIFSGYYKRVVIECQNRDFDITTFIEVL